MSKQGPELPSGSEEFFRYHQNGLESPTWRSIIERLRSLQAELDHLRTSGQDDSTFELVKDFDKELTSAGIMGARLEFTGHVHLRGSDFLGTTELLEEEYGAVLVKVEDAEEDKVFRVDDVPFYLNGAIIDDDARLCLVLQTIAKGYDEEGLDFVHVLPEEAVIAEFDPMPLEDLLSWLQYNAESALDQIDELLPADASDISRAIEGLKQLRLPICDSITRERLAQYITLRLDFDTEPNSMVIDGVIWLEGESDKQIDYTGKIDQAVIEKVIIDLPITEDDMPSIGLTISHPLSGYHAGRQSVDVPVSAIESIGSVRGEGPVFEAEQQNQIIEESKTFQLIDYIPSGLINNENETTLLDELRAKLRDTEYLQILGSMVATFEGGESFFPLDNSIEGSYKYCVAVDSPDIASSLSGGKIGEEFRLLAVVLANATGYDEHGYMSSDFSRNDVVVPLYPNTELFKLNKSVSRVDE